LIKKKELKIDTIITTKEKDGLISILYKYVDVFAWTCINMSGLDTNIVVYRIPSVEESKPVKQKTRHMCPYCCLR
jgi:hypothetical protein